MGALSFLGYLRLKLLATILRLFIRWKTAKSTGSNLLSPNDIIERSRVRIPSRDPGRFIDGWLYTSRASSGKQPVLINWHGSGFVIPALGSDHTFCARVAREIGITVLDADYRKGPETPFPGPLLDAEDAVRWIASQPQRYDLDRIALSGFSAGANFALVAASSLRKDFSGVQIPVVVGVYPLVDLTIDPAQKKAPQPRQPIPGPLGRFFNDCYVRDQATKKNPLVSPGLADTSLYPDTVVIVTCDGDVLMPEATALAARLENGKRKVVNLTLEGIHHGFDKGCQEGTEEAAQRDKAYSLIIRSLQEALRL